MEALILIILIIYIGFKEFFYHRHLSELEEKLMAGSLEKYYAFKEQKETPPNPIANTGKEESPNEITITDDNPMPLPKEFNLQVEGEEKPRKIKLEDNR